MKIEPRIQLTPDNANSPPGDAGGDGGEDRRQMRREELRRILKSDSAGVPVCAADCPAAGPERCSRHCPDIPKRMSSDPEYPLEDGIAPLAFELKQLGAFQPCWSCEGHKNASGDFWKKPSVWFYCESVVHLRVLANTIKELHLTGRLSVPWRVALTFSDPDNPDTTFALEPNLEAAETGKSPRLEDLQRDTATIAEHLRGTAFDETRKLITGIA